MNVVGSEELVYDIARAWAFIDGNGEEFDNCMDDPDLEDELGRADGYLSEARHLIETSPSLNRIFDFIKHRESING